MEIELKKTLTDKPFSVAEAFWLHQNQLLKIKPRFQSLFNAVGHPGDLFLTQWAQLAAATIEFKPDLIIELGRGRGNSTCAFTETSKLLSKKAKVASFCLSDDWQKITEPRIRAISPPEWFDNLIIYNENILSFPFEELTQHSERCLVFWDAHGFDIAECVLGKILPLVAQKKHLVIMHDLSDTRYSSLQSRFYGENGLWKGNNWSGPRLRLGHIDSAVEQAIAIVDFTTRNEIELQSADHDLNQYCLQHQDQHKQLTIILGADYFSLSAHWFYFSLNQKVGILTFPKPTSPTRPEVKSEEQETLGENLSFLSKLKKSLKKKLGQLLR